MKPVKLSLRNGKSAGSKVKTILQNELLIMFGKNVIKDGILASENQSWEPVEPTGSFYKAILRYSYICY